MELDIADPSHADRSRNQQDQNTSFLVNNHHAANAGLPRTSSSKNESNSAALTSAQPQSPTAFPPGNSAQDPAMSSFTPSDGFKHLSEDNHGYTNDHSRSRSQHKHGHSSLPSPPLSSAIPALGPTFPPSEHFSPVLQERCEAMEYELSELRHRLQHSEQSSTLREKRLSQAQQQSSNTQQSLRTLKQQHEITLIQLSKLQADSTHARTLVDERDKQIQDKGKEISQLKYQLQEQGSELKEVLLDRDSMSLEMVECHSDNAKFLKRLRASNEKVDSLQDENRHLIEQLRELRARLAEVSDERAKLTERLDRERQCAGQAALELERVVARYKAEVERLQDLVLAMGHKYVQVQAQLAFFQHQAQARQLHAIQPLAIERRASQEESCDLILPFSSLSSSISASLSNGSPSLYSLTPSTSESLSQHHSGGIILGDSALASILSSVAATSHSRRSKPTRRFTVNATFHQEAPLTLEQRKCEFLMDQITVLQRGYDSLRQEKVTLELQLDLMQRQHQFQQQQRQKRQDTLQHQQQYQQQRKALGQEQQQYLENTRAAAMKTLPSSEPSDEQDSPLVAKSPDVRGQGPRQQEQKRVAEEAEKVQQAKDVQIQEALASLESKHGRSDSRAAQITNPDELKHLERLRITHEENATQEQQQQASSSSPFFATALTSQIKNDLQHYTQHTRSHSHSHSQKHPHPHQQHQHRGLAARGYDQVEWDVQQCSCCMGVLIEI